MDKSKILNWITLHLSLSAIIAATFVLVVIALSEARELPNPEKTVVYLATVGSVALVAIIVILVSARIKPPERSSP